MTGMSGAMRAMTDAARASGRFTKSLSLSTYLVMMSAALIIPTMFVSGMALISLTRTEMAASRDRVAQAARDLSADIDREVNGLLTVLETLATAQSLATGDLMSFHARATAALNTRRAYVLLLDTNFQQLLNTRLPFGSSLPSTSDRKSAAHVLATGDPYVSDSFRGAVSGTDVVNVLMPVRKDGAIRFLLIITIDTQRIGEILRGFNVPSRWEMSIIDRAGRAFAVRDGDATHAGGKSSRQAVGEMSDDVTFDHKSQLTGWTTRVRAPVGAIDGPLWRGLGWLTIAGLLATLSAAIFVRWLSLRLANGISEIQRATEDLASGRPVSGRPLPISETITVMSGLERASRLIQARTERLRDSEARYRAGLRVGRIGSWETDFSRGTRTWSREAEELFGLHLVDGKGVVGGDNDELLRAMHPDDRHLLAQFHNRIALHDHLDAEYRILLPNGSVRHVSGRGEVVSRDPNGRPRMLVNVVSDITERAVAEQQAADYLKDIAAAKARFEALVKATSQIVWTATRSGEVVEDSPSWRRFTGQTFEQFRGAGWLDVVHPDDRANALSAWRRAVDDVSPYQVDYRLLHVEKGYRWTSARGVPQLTDSGEVIDWVGMNEDISDRVAREDHLQVVLRELSHRTKNLLAVVQAIARRTFANTHASDVPLKTFRDRLRGLAISHDLLVHGDWTGISLEQLVREHLKPFASDDAGQIEISGPFVMIRPEAAQNFGLALHELATNATKYGALRNQGGHLRISWQLERDKVAGRTELAFTWSERPGVVISQSGHSGFGAELLKSIVATSLSGKASYRVGEAEITWSLTAPLAAMQSQPSDSAASHAQAADRV